ADRGRRTVRHSEPSTFAVPPSPGPKLACRARPLPACRQVKQSVELHRSCGCTTQGNASPLLRSLAGVSAAPSLFEAAADCVGPKGRGLAAQPGSNGLEHCLMCGPRATARTSLDEDPLTVFLPRIIGGNQP